MTERVFKRGEMQSSERMSVPRRGEIY